MFFVTAAGKLTENDPHRTNVSINLWKWDEESSGAEEDDFALAKDDDVELAHALERNDYVNEIEFAGAHQLLKVTSPLVFVMPKRLLAVWAIQIRVDMFACYGSNPYCVNI